jgi:hypothetical protein
LPFIGTAYCQGEIMGLMDILQTYAARPTSTEDDFAEVAPQLSPDLLGHGVAQAFRSEQTPPFGNMVSQLFGNSNPQLRAGLLSQLIAAVGPAVLSRFGGALGRLTQGGAAAPHVTPDAAAEVTPDQVREIAAEAEKKDPGILDRVGNFYGQHPDIVKGLGGAALAIALGQIANRMQR